MPAEPDRPAVRLVPADEGLLHYLSAAGPSARVPILDAIPALGPPEAPLEGAEPPTVLELLRRRLALYRRALGAADQLLDQVGMEDLDPAVAAHRARDWRRRMERWALEEHRPL